MQHCAVTHSEMLEEALHLASEAHDPEEVRSLAETCFETADKLSE